MKILFVMEPRFEAGSIQAVANYVRAGNQLGHTIAVYGGENSNFPYIRFSTDVSAFDYVILIFESNLYWPKRLQLAHILSGVPRKRRVILDADGMYHQRIVIDNYDRNHWQEKHRLDWFAHYRGLADKILQPTLEPSQQKNVVSVPFYGYNIASEIAPDTAPPKIFDILYVGHNWWRWRQVSQELLPAIEPIRDQLGTICFMGLWWDKLQSWAIGEPWEIAYQMDSDWWRRLQIQVKPPVPYVQVIPTMSQSRINIMTQRPLLRHLKHLTSKYFELFCSDTIPLVMLDPDHAEKVYGPKGRELTLHDRIGDKLLEVLHQPQKYKDLVQGVRRHLRTNHSYEKRLEELVEALES